MFKVGDKVVYKDYPKIQGRVVYRTRHGFLLVVWDNPRPSFFGGNVRMAQIPSALLHAG